MLNLVVGLGNPGKDYADTRHNVGFMVVGILAQKYNINLAKRNLRFKSYVGTGRISDKRVILALPLTYMNASGKSVRRLCSYYDIKPEDVLVVHDDLDIPFGKIKIKWKGGDGGHKGISSIINELGTNDFLRLRVGLSRPPEEIDAAAYVLQSFSKQERINLPDVIEVAVDAVELILKSGYERAMDRYN